MKGFYLPTCPRRWSSFGSEQGGNVNLNLMSAPRMILPWWSKCAGSGNAVIAMRAPCQSLNIALDASFVISKWEGGSSPQHWLAGPCGVALPILRCCFTLTKAESATKDSRQRKSPFPKLLLANENRQFIIQSCSRLSSATHIIGGTEVKRWLTYPRGNSRDYIQPILPSWVWQMPRLCEAKKLELINQIGRSPFGE
jgi:hypothetical protein